MNNDWKNDPISRKQISMLRSVDEWFTFDRLSKMTKGEASDYISEYYKDKQVIEDNINMRFKKEGGSKLVIGDIMKDIEVAIKGVLSKYGVE